MKINQQLSFIIPPPALPKGPRRNKARWPALPALLRQNRVACAKSRGEAVRRAQRRHSPSKTGVNALKAILRTLSSVPSAVAHPTPICDAVELVLWH